MEENKASYEALEQENHPFVMYIIDILLLLYVNTKPSKKANITTQITNFNPTSKPFSNASKLSKNTSISPYFATTK
jgi:hypothetical protein